MAKKTVTVTFSTRPTTEQYIEELAAKINRPKSWVINHAISLLQKHHAGRDRHRRANGI